MKFICKYIVLFFCFGSFAQNITSPQIGCVDVLPNGNITITWQIPPDPLNQFKDYVIYYSTALNNPSYSQELPFINNYNTNTATIIGINANTQPYFIYIQTITQAGSTLPAVDTVRTLFLNVSQAVGSPGVAHLTWTGFALLPPAGEATSYSLYREFYYDGGGWKFIASVPFNANGNINYSYFDTICVCKDSVNYQVVLNDPALGCSSSSNIAGEHLSNKNAPSVPRIDSVSVITNGVGQEQTIIGLSSAYSQDVKCFVIYSSNGATYTFADSECTYNRDTVYIYTSPSPANGSITLSAISQDSCLNQSQFPFNPQSTIYTTVSYDICMDANIIRWTPYQNMVTGVKDYEIYYSTFGTMGSFYSLGDTDATVYYHRGVSLGTPYWYFVRAHSNGQTIHHKDSASSTSNQFSLTTANPPVSHFAYLSNVTVNAQQTLDVQWHIDNMVPINGYNLYRATNKTGSYSLVTFIPTSNQIDNLYTDNNVNTNNQEYFYYVQVLDTCNNPTIKTQDTSNSIVLKAVPSANLTATLNWNGYAKYLGNVSGYTIYRSVNNGAFASVYTVSGTTIIYTDNLSPFATDEGVFIYYVQAIEGPGNPYNLVETSQSNYDTVYMDANLYIPNSFTPTFGINKVFLPIGAYIDSTNYTLDIFNRYGIKIFESTDPNTGWDGGGHEEGVYAYTVQYKTSIGEFRQRNGTVNLIR